ncbi:MAG: hypothetical protein OXI30_08030 [Chloroflexota bacterium]|nr:hypothetical protein [Chloroflexota bacterium]
MLNLKIVIGLISLVLAFFEGNSLFDVTFRPSIALVSNVESVAPAADDESNWQLRARLSFDENCDVEPQSEVTYYPNNIDIQLYRLIPSTIECGDEEEQFELQLTLSNAAELTYLIINDRAWKIRHRASRETSVSNRPSLHETSLFPVWVDEANLSFDDDANQYNLSYRGVQAMGCALPEIYSLRQASGGALLAVYNAMPADVVCPAVEALVDEKITLSATDVPADTLFSVNTYPIGAIEEQAVNESDKVLSNIFRVDVQVKEARISLDVAGEHPDGCEFPVIVAQTRRGNTVDVEVYREVPADVICPMILKPYRDMISLDGEFAPGVYTINVNSHSQAVNI